MKKILVIQSFNPLPWTVGTVSTGRSGGKVFGRISKDAKLKNYQEGVNEDFHEAFPEVQPFPKGTPIVVEFFFWRHLDQYQTKTGRNQTSKRCDVTNASKAIEDALQDCLYHNDVDNRATLPVMVEQGVDVDQRIVVVATDHAYQPGWEMADYEAILASVPSDAPMMYWEEQ